MVKLQFNRKGFKDVFNSFLVSGAEYEGIYEIPRLRKENVEIPKKLVLFSDLKKEEGRDKWVCFYEDDFKIEPIWNNPRKYLKRLSKFGGIITPDFSTYRDMPAIMQGWNIYRSRALGHWFQKLGFNVIPNVRWGDNRTVTIACQGIEKHSIISIGSHGAIKDRDDRKFFIEGLDTVIRELEPLTILIYGSVPNDIFDFLEFQGINVIHYPSKINCVYSGGLSNG